MTPEDIAKQFGDETLMRLYDQIFNRPIHVLADWILSMYSPADIQQWIDDMKTDDENDESWIDDMKE